MVKNCLVSIVLIFACLKVCGQVVINEVCSSNADIKYDPDFFNFSPWVELFNAGNTSVSLSGYYLSDDAAQPTRWIIPGGTTIPAKGYLLIWCDGMSSGIHTNFSLESNGESIVLSSNTQQVIDQIALPEQYTNISYGRITDGGTVWSHLIAPTPEGENKSKNATVPLTLPQVSIKSGRYSGAQTVALTHSIAGAEIRYSLDGTEPKATSQVYTKPFSITGTSTLKAKAFYNGFIPSSTLVETYFINEHTSSLPVVSISTPPNFLWNNVIGIYADGSNGTTGNCKDIPVNWNQDWDRHATIELFDESGKRKFNQHVDIRIGGGCSRNNPQKSLVVKARDKYGNNTLDEKLFAEKPHDRFGGFILRNSGSDFNVTMFRDALMQTLAREQMELDYLAYKPAILYLNGQYWGIQNIREKVDADYIETNYGIKKNDIDLIESWGAVLEGTNEAYNSYLNTLQTLTPIAPTTFSYIDQHIDVQEFINYLVTEIYFGNTDWPGNNVKFWRQRSTNGKFRWILWDLDFGFALYPFWSYATHPTLTFATDPNSGVDWPNPPWSTVHIRTLLQNPEFKNRFIQTLTTAMGTGFSPQRINEVITSFQNQIKTEMPFHKQRWGGNISDWDYEVQRLRTFASERNQFMKKHLASFFGLSEGIKVSAASFPDGTGNIKLNGVKLTAPVAGADYFRNIPFEAEPLPMPGYKFKHWVVKKNEVTVNSLFTAGANWKYFDKGTIPAADWNQNIFNDNTWSSGPAQFGYGDGDEQTAVNYGLDANNKYITTYFRKNFTITNASQLSTVDASVLFDDGVVVYLNGTEIFRNNMPTGAINNTTLATSAIADENVFYNFSIPPTLLAEGDNIIAVEVHQNLPQSSDISFDFKLTTSIQGAVQTFTIVDPSLTGIADSNVSIEAYFEQALPVTGLVINEIGAAGTSITDEFDQQEDWIEVYNTSTVPVDLSGLFITDNLQNKRKHQFLMGTSNTIIDPGEYKILWADNQTGQGSLHTNFRLSADGEQVGLYQMVGATLETLDEITFEKHIKNNTASRIPNVTGPMVITSKPTPSAVNIFEVVTRISQSEDQSLNEIYPNPASDKIWIVGEGLRELKIINSIGTVVKVLPLHTDMEISVAELAAGMYLLVIVSDSSATTHRLVKF